MADTDGNRTASASPRRQRRRASSPRAKKAARPRQAAAKQPDPGNSVERARLALGKAGAASKKTIDRLLKGWRRMDTSRKLQFAAALLGALAAASAPIVRSRMKKK
ncbi:MAG: hypothetical protein ACRD00_02995 [Thermoanaerobaculia bacterium]